MILDYRSDAGHAWRYRILDAETGVEIDEPIFYADDEAGVYRVYLKDEQGQFYFRFVEAATGQPIDTASVVPGSMWKYGDGISRVWVKDEQGTPPVEADHEPAWEEHRRPLRFEPKGVT